METELLHCLNLSSDKGRDVSKKNAVCSIMQGISISDASAINKAETALLQKIDISAEGQSAGKGKTLPLFRECVLPGSEFCCTMKLDRAMLKMAGINGIDEVLQAAADFYDFIIAKWQKVFGKMAAPVFNDAAGGNIFLGGGTGFYTKTILAALAPDDAAALELIRELLSQQFRKHKHMMDKRISPRTLKVTSWQGKQYMQGIAKVEKL